jgi:hypothetical protein
MPPEAVEFAKNRITADPEINPKVKVADHPTNGCAIIGLLCMLFASQLEMRAPEATPKLHQ